MQEGLEKTVKKALPENQTVPYVLALSGGIDSMTLFHVLKALKKDFVVAHVNHKKRPESDNEYIEIKALCKDHDIPFEGSEFANISDGNFQKNARLFRQKFFKETALKYGSTTIITAHHFDDLLETFLMRIVEGRSLSGLTPMKNVLRTDDGFTFIKPFIDIQKTQIEAYSKVESITYFKDLSNDSDIYTRNRIRRTLIPILEKENPKFRKTVRTTLEDIGDLNTFLESEVRTHPLFKEKKMSVPQFLAFTDAMKRRFLRRKLDTYIPSFYPSKKYLDDIIHQLRTTRNFTMKLNDEYSLHKEYGVFFIVKNPHEKKEVPPTVIKGHGRYKISDTHTLIVTDKKKAAMLTKPFVLWYNDDVYPLIMRTRENGDTINFSYGHKKVNRLFIDQKIAPHKRDEILLLTDTYKNVLWIPYLDIKQKSSKGKHCLYFYLITDNYPNQ